MLFASGLARAESLRIVLRESGSDVQELKSWTLDELKTRKTATSTEQDPETGKAVTWKGVLLQTLLEEAMSKLPAEKKAHVDLVLLKNAVGSQALVPRSFIVKFPMLLAMQADQKALTERGPLYSVPPWTSKPKTAQEQVPLETFFLSKVSEIELANYRDRFGHVFLKRRTDPAAMRGEKLFVQTCVSCHSAGRNPTFQELLTEDKRRTIASQHSPARGLPRFSDRDWRSLSSFVEAYRAEN